MIKSIQEVKNFGVFNKYTKQVDDFEKFNLFYGWNGSGKSTISNLFSYLSSKKIDDNFDNVEFKIEFKAGDVIEKHSLGNVSEKVCVFNEEFIRQNIDWNNTVKSILMISEEKISERKELEEVLKQYEIKYKEMIAARNEFDKKNSTIEKHLTDYAKNIKTQFNTLSTNDSYYINYNKTKLRNIIDNDILIYSTMILKDEEVLKIKDIVKPQRMQNIGLRLSNLDEQYILGLISEINLLLDSTIISNTIEELVKDTELAKWIETGINIHNNDEASICKFCGNNINSERINKLNNHFNDKFKEFQKQIRNLEEAIKNIIVNLSISVDSNVFYDEFKQDATTIKESLYYLLERIKVNLEGVTRNIEEKSLNPFIKISEAKLDLDSIKKYNLYISKFNSIIESHNDKCDNFNRIIKENQKKLERHYASKFVEDNKYGSLKKEISKLEKKINTLDREAELLKDKSNKLESDILNENIAIPQFNKMLTAFLGHNEIGLEFDRIKKGYKIIRTSTGVQAKNLSEGEKTAIAFVYFMIKIKESGSELDELILVLDDPISSFDSKHIYNVYSYIKNELEGCKQMFILTHNFSFFKLIRDWIMAKNNKRKIKSKLYKIEVIKYGPKESSLFNVEESLEKYSSEYQYLFDRLVGYSKKVTLSLEETFMVANISRKLLEAFMNFKRPKNRKDFKVLFDECVKDKHLNARVYKFINRYSHYSPAIMSEDEIDNLLAESNDIIIDVFRIYKSLDEIHLNEMLQISNYELNLEELEYQVEAEEEAAAGVAN